MTNVVKRIEVHGKEIGLDNLKAKVDQVAASQRGAAVASDQMARSTGSVDTRLNRLQRSLDVNYRAQQASASAQRLLNQGLAQGSLSYARYTELMDMASQKYAVNSSAARANAMATQAMASAHRAASFQMRNIQFQMIDIAQGIPLLFQSATFGLLNLANQGAQIAQVYGPNEGGAARAFREAAAMAGRFAVRLAPVAVAVGVASLAMVGLQNDIEETTGASVALGTIAKAALLELADSVMTTASPAFQWLGRVVSATGDLIFDTLKLLGNSIINTFEFSYLAVVSTWRELPAAIADLAVQATQGLLNQMTAMAREVVAIWNGMLAKLDLRHLQVGNPSEVIPDIVLNNSNAGAANDLAVAYQDAYAVFENDRLGDGFSRTGERARTLAEETDEATRSLNGFQSAVQSMQRATQSLRDEATFFGPENTYALLEHTKAQELLNAAMDAGVTITDQVRSQVGNLASEYVSAVQNLDSLKDAQERFNSAVESVKSVTNGFFQSFSNQLQKGASFWDAFKSAGLNALGSISSKLLELASSDLVGSLMGSFNPAGGSGGLLSGLLGSIPGFAMGTNNAPGGLAWVGENGRELVNLPRGSQVIPNHKLTAVNSNHRQPSNSNINMSVAVDGSVSRAEAEEIAGAMADRLREEFPETVINTMVEHRKYGGRV